MLPPMQLNFEIDLTSDVEVLYGAANTIRFVIDRFYLWVPRLEPKDALIAPAGFLAPEGQKPEEAP